jgi:hypothetical protein
MKTFYRFILVIFCLTAALFTPGWSACKQFEEEFNRDFKLEPGGGFSLINVCGNIEVCGWDQNTVQIRAVKMVRRVSNQEEAQEWLNKIEIGIEQEGNTIRVEAKFPENRELYIRKSRDRETLFKKILSGLASLPWGKAQVEVTFKVMLPRRTDVDLCDNLGDIEASNLEGNIKAKTDMGTIKMAGLSGDLTAGTAMGEIVMEGVKGSVEAGTDLGSITASLETVEPGNNISLHSDMGGISLALPGSTGADLDLSTELGGINVDLPVTVQGEITRERISGKINGGGPLIKVSTDLGGVEIKKL